MSSSSSKNFARRRMCRDNSHSWLRLPVRRMSRGPRSLELLRTAGAVAPELADVARQIETRRRQNQARLIASLCEQGELRSGLELAEATDVLWARKGYDLYRMLVVEQRWEPERYETWLAQLLVQHLLVSH